MAIQKGNVEVRDPSTTVVAMAYRAFKAAFSQAITPTTETPLLLLSNPSNNPVPLTVFKRDLIAATVGHTAIFKTYANPTGVSLGTAITPQNLRVNSGAPAATGTAKLLPTATPGANLIDVLSSIGGANVNDSDPIIVDPGNTLLITVQVSNASDVVEGAIGWSE